MQTRIAPSGLAALAIAAAALVLHVATSGVYPIFRDEYYYLACADHMDWGYVDHPPLSIAVLFVVKSLFGDSIWALRIVPALCGSVLILLAARLAREMGGGSFAEAFSALAVAIAPVNLALTGFYSMNCLDMVFWALLALVLVRLVKTDDPKGWLLFGVLAGLGLLNKINVLFLGAGVAAALVLTPLRRHLKSPYPWAGGLLALVLFSTYLVWEVRHGWPTLEFMANAQKFKIAAMTPGQFLGAQVAQVHPVNAPVWAFGLFGLFLGRDLRRFRALGITFVTVFVLIAVQRAKPYYLAPAYTMLFPAGAVVLEELTARFHPRRLRPALVAVLVCGGAVALPLVVPLLPPTSFVAYERALGETPHNEERQALGPLPQLYADRFGWEELTLAVKAAYDSLPPEDRKKVLIVTQNYGEAGALNYLGRRYGLPAALSQHNNFYYWGPKGDDAQIVITVGKNGDDLRGVFDRVVESGRIVAPYAMPYETERPIYICYGLKIPLQEAWKLGRLFI